MTPLILTLLILNTASVHAAVVELPHSACVNASLAKAVKSITTYTDYPTLPGATLSVNGFEMLKMKHSLVQVDGKYINLKRDSVDKALLDSLSPTKIGEKKKVSIGTKLQPAPALMGDDQSKLFPKFWINCDYGYVSSAVFEQECHQDLSDEAPRFAVSGFDSKLTLSSDSGKCANGQVLLSFHLTLTTNDAQVEQIKNGIAASENPVFALIKKKVVQTFFEQKSFFLHYFKNFYDGWAQSL